MANTKSENKLSTKELETWLVYLATGTVDNKKELTKKDKDYLDRISKRETSLNNATTIAKFVNEMEVQGLQRELTLIKSTTSLLLYVLQEKLGIDDETFAEYVKEYEESIEKYAEELRQANEKQQQAFEEVPEGEEVKPNENPSNDNVVEFKPSDK